MKKLLTIVLIVLFPSMILAQVNFIGGTPPIPVLNSPLFIAISDFNADGNLDIVTANYASSTISVALGLGNLTYSPAVNYNVGTNPYKIATGDFNADGKIDLVTPNAGSDNFSILIGNGNGTFMSAVNYSTGNDPYGILVADFDGDGDQDIATSNYVSNNVAVHMGNGNGTFGGAAYYTVGTRPQCLQAADFNNDGALDIAVENGFSNTVNILLGNGNGTFNMGSVLTTGTLPNSLIIGDFNNDGESDVATSNNSSGSISVFTGFGDGTFASVITITGIPTPGCINATDFNRDGNLDLVTANAYSNNVTVVTGNGNGTFASPVNFVAVNNPNAANMVADFNNDGWVDIAVSDYSANKVYILLGACLSAPAQPAVINGPDSICSYTTNTYSVPLVAGGVTYNWTLPIGWTGTSTTNSINATSNNNGGTISLNVSNNCGTSPSRTFAITMVNEPSSPGNISGPATICANTINTYSITPVNGAAYYTWTLPNGWTGSSVTNSITATATANGGNITVTSVNMCGVSSPSILAVTIINIPLQPGNISGPATICGNTMNTYSVVPVNGASSYTWTLPNGWTGSSITNSIITTANTNGGNITVTATNSCGTSPAAILPVTVNNIPSQPGAISGPINICENTTNTYSIVAVNGASSYTWTLPNGWTGNSVTNTISTTANSLGGNITVTANNNCGSSIPQILAVQVTVLPVQPGPISGTISVCPNSLNSYMVSPVNGATSYTWTLPNGWSGASTSNTINTSAGINGGNITVTATNMCGTSPAQTLSVITFPVYSFNNTATICQNDSIFIAGAYRKNAGMYIANLLTVHGCDSIINTTLVVNPLPTVNLANQNDFCENDGIFPLTGGLPLGGTYSGPGVNNNQFDPASAGVGTHTITYSYTNPNTGCSNSTTNTILVNPLPPVPVITGNGVSLMSSSISGNQWYLNGSPINGATGQGYNCIANGTYMVCVTNASGCKSCSEDFVFTTIGILNYNADKAISVYPNPFTYTITIDLLEENKSGRATMLNVLGEILYFQEIKARSVLDVGSLPAGMYMLQIETEGEVITKKMIKE